MKSISPIVAFLALAALVGCSHSPSAPELSVMSLLSDPQFFALDAGAPSNRFDGCGGSLLLGDGWSLADVQHFPSGEVNAAGWAVDGAATLYFIGPLSGAVDFYAWCYPYSYPGAPPQAIDFTLDGVPAGHAEVREDGHELRVPLSQQVSRGRLHRLDLRFARAKRPSEVSSNPDRRVLCVNFTTVAIVPREVPVASAFLRASSFDPKSGVLKMPEGGAAAIPVPAQAEFRLHLGKIEGGCSQCSVSADLVAGATVRNLFRKPAGRASGARVVFDTKGLPIGRLILSVCDASGRAVFDAAALTKLVLPKDFLLIRRREKSSRQERPDLFVYLVDTLRADELEPYGSRRADSPAIASFAKDAVVYEKTWAASTWTLPSVVSILSGVYPIRHGIMQGEYRYVDTEIPSLARVLGGAGYDTVGISQSLLSSHKFGVDAGFAEFFYGDRLGPELRSQEVRAYLMQYFGRGSRRRPTFCYLHTVDTHSPYTPRGRYERFARETPGRLPPNCYDPVYFLGKDMARDPAEVAHLRALYDGEVLYADEQFGRFLDTLKWLGRYDGSAIVLVADHGEEFAEHGGFDHGRTVYEELLRVPLIVKYPKSRWAGMRVAGRVSAVDIYPTFLKLAGVGLPSSNLDGQILFPPAELDGGRKVRAIYSEVSPVAEKTGAEVNYRAIALGRLKGIESATGIDQFCRAIPTWRVFDLDADAGERSPLDPADPRVNECWQALNALLVSEQRKARFRESDRSRVDEEYIRKLRALGYLN